MRASLQAGGLFRFRWLLFELVLRDLKLRYRGSIFGLAWTLLNPLLFMLVYTLVFTIFLRIGAKNYPVYVLAGMIPWNWFTLGISQGTTSILDGRMYVGRSVFPVQLLPLVPVLSSGVNFALSLPLLFALMAIYHVHVGAALLTLPLLILIELAFVSGASLICATYDVFYRDLQQLISYALTALFFLTPIFYRADTVDTRFRAWFQWNPLAAIIEPFHSVLYAGRYPDWGTVGYAAFCSALLLALGIAAFNRHREVFSQYL
jgi:ABC-type polysaccharide/polyol phosphate export permease